MTYTINSDCSIISLDSTYLSPDNQVVNLFWDKNCSGTLGKISVNTSASLIQVDPADLNESATFSDGVYYFKISITQEDGTVVEESLCRFVNCNSSCLMLPIYKLTDLASVIKQLAFEALLASADCTSCSCTDLCALYNNTGLTVIPNDDCGCN
jgi:hypothetical protein